MLIGSHGGLERTSDGLHFNQGVGHMIAIQHGQILLIALPPEVRRNLNESLSKRFHQQWRRQMKWFWRRRTRRTVAAVLTLTHLLVGSRAEAMGLSHAFALHLSGMRFGTGFKKSISFVYFCEELSKATEISFADAEIIWKAFLDLVGSGRISLSYADHVENKNNWIHVSLKSH